MKMGILRSICGSTAKPCCSLWQQPHRGLRSKTWIMTSEGLALKDPHFSKRRPHDELMPGKVVSTSEQTLYRARLFQNEYERQMKNRARIEKVRVDLQSQKLGSMLKNVPEALKMNKHFSTPSDCIKHISEAGSDLVGLAHVQEIGSQITRIGQVEEVLDWVSWDVHRPFTKDSRVEFITYDMNDPQKMDMLNKAYWRSCSMLLGWILETSFKEEFPVLLHSWPGADYRSGSFVYDCKIKGLENWKPSEEERQILGRTLVGKIRGMKLPFQPLSVSVEVAQKIFKHNELKLEQLESVSLSDVEGRVPLYKVGDFVDISKGPMIANTRQIGNFSIVAVETLDSDWGPLLRFRGVSVPAHHRLDSWTWDIIEGSAKREGMAAMVGGIRHIGWRSHKGLGHKEPQQRLSYTPLDMSFSRKAQSLLRQLSVDMDKERSLRRTERNVAAAYRAIRMSMSGVLGGCPHLICSNGVRPT